VQSTIREPNVESHRKIDTDVRGNVNRFRPRVSNEYNRSRRAVEPLHHVWASLFFPAFFVSLMFE
jgi:hypothetical protein